MTQLRGPVRLAVWGSPVAHSRSPQLHGAAYRVLGLDWEYGRRDVGEADFGATLAGLEGSWRGLSVTMPLKARAFQASVRRDRRAELTGAVNTLLLDRDTGPRGVNTDVGGLVRSLREEGVEEVESARLIGAGATAASALVALAELGAAQVDVFSRRPAPVASLTHLGAELGVMVRPRPPAGDLTPWAAADVTIGTLPGGTVLDDAVAATLSEGGGLLVDVAYSPWPSALATEWERRGQRAISGLPMLLHQALLQVRFFVAGDVEAPLADEHAVLAAMRAALMGD